ncbi:MAG: hypothetical protein U0360_02005 [Dehalococcoidia bacterium]
MATRGVLAIGLLAAFAALAIGVRAAVEHGSRPTGWQCLVGAWPARIHLDGRTGEGLLALVATFETTSSEAVAPGAAPGVGVLGNANPTHALDWADSDCLIGTRYVTGRDAGRVTSMSALVGSAIDAPPHNAFSLAIYQDAHGSPGALLARTAEGSLDGPGWYTLPLETALAPDTAYWLMYTTNGSSPDVNNLATTPIVTSGVDYLVRREQNEMLRAGSSVATWFGNSIPAGATVLILLGYLGWRHRAAALAYLTMFLVGLGVVLLSKATLLPEYDGYPSGHLFRTTFVATALARAIPGLPSTVLGIVLVLAEAFGAIYQYGHNFEEAVGGVLLAGGLAAAAPLLERVRVRLPWRLPQRAHARV